MKVTLFAQPVERIVERELDAAHEVVDLDWNRGPIAKRKGSAIFLHVANPAFGATEGCIALSAGDLRKLLTRLGPRSFFEVAR